MRKNLWLLVAIVLMFFKEGTAQAYDYIPFPDSGFTWTGKTTCLSGLGGSSYSRSWTLYISGDTTIDNHVYHVIKKDSIIPFYYVREDSFKRVFLRFRDADTLLFDFGVNVGDTTTCLGGVYVVNRIDTLIYNGIPRRRLLMEYPANTYMGDLWIEGIGSVSGGPLGYGWHWFYCQPATSSSLCMAQKNTTILYGNNCSVQVDIENIQEPVVAIYPNPATSFITVKLAQQPVNGISFLLYDVEGRLVKEADINSTITTVKLDYMNSCIYFWQIKSDSRILNRGKLLIE